LTLGIGINTGAAQVGNTGSTRKFKYGPHGHTVNLASRLQGLCKPLNTPLLVSAATRSRLPPGFAARRLGMARLLGIDTPAEVHELTAPGRPDPGWRDYRDVYESALELYEAGRFQEAHQALVHLLDMRHLQDFDIPTELLIKQVLAHMNNPSTPSDAVIYRAQ
jgi:adenylate cyclase